MHAIIYSQATLLAALRVLKVVALKLPMRVGRGEIVGRNYQLRAVCQDRGVA